MDMSLYTNFNEQNNVDALWEKIGVMFENKNTVNRVSIFRKIVTLQYQDGSNMAEHINAFHGLMNQTTALEVSFADEVFALLLLGSLLENARCHIGQRWTGREASIPRAGEVELDE